MSLFCASSLVAAALWPMRTASPHGVRVLRQGDVRGRLYASAATRSWQNVAEKDGMEFVGSFTRPQEMPRTLVPEITLAGRSNVGKSSALNALSCRRKKLAVVSKTPGRTRLINLFRVGTACTITDLPGYGFAKVSRDLQDAWQKQITAYLKRREQLRLAIVFVDAQREPQEADAQLLDFMEAQDMRTLVVATKSDKLSGPALKASLERLYALSPPPRPPTPLKSPWARLRMPPPFS